MANIVTYKNGNYDVALNLSDGTMIRWTEANELRPEFPDSMDVKITNRCDKGCPWCHERSTGIGKHANWDSLEKFIVGLPRYTQLALGGGNVLDYPWLTDLLHLCKENDLISSITINQTHFMDAVNYTFLKKLVADKLIYGIGVSLVEVTPDFIYRVKQFPNAVIHIIGGIVTEEELTVLANNDLKILILGYKEFGRGIDYLNEQHKEVSHNLHGLRARLQKMIDQKEFSNISFDNLALKQLDVRSLLTEEQWNQFYMGNDGVSTMYVDMVQEQFARCSTSYKRYPLLEDVREMLEVIHKERE